MESGVRKPLPQSFNPSDIGSTIFSSIDLITEEGAPIVTSPEPDLTAEWAQRDAAPVLPDDPAIISEWP